MNDASTTDAVVIGGGPAGAVAALLLTAWGRSVTVLARGPARNVLAESLPPSCRKLFDRIGISAAVDGAGFVRATGNTVLWGGATPTAHAFGGEAMGWQVERDRFDRVLLDATARAGASIRTPASVRSVGAPEDKGARRVVYDAHGATRKLTARWVIDASGRTGVTVPRDGRQSVEGGRTLALVAHWKRAGGWPVEDPTHTLVESYDDGWAWSVPVASGERVFALMVAPAAAAGAGGSNLATLYRRELGRTTWFRELVADAETTVEPWACDASPYGTTRVGGDGLVLAGDAATFVDPLSSYGVKKAMASAWLAAIVVNTCLDTPDLEAAALSLHAARERAMYESLSRQSAALAREAAGAHTRAFWEDRAAVDVGAAADGPDVAALRTDPDVVRAFEDLRAREAIRLRRVDSLELGDRPVVRDNRIALVEHLVVPAFPEGVRYIRDVDLVTLTTMVADFDQVPDLFEAYNRSAPPVALPDFLGALSVLLGKGVLRHA